MSTDLQNIKFDKNGKLSKKGEYTIFDLEKRLFESLNKFNTTYAYYIRCTKGKPELDKTNCPKKNVHQDDVKYAYNNVDKNINAFNKAITYLNNVDSPKSYDKSYNKIKTEYNQVVNLRADLDQKMKEILGTYDSVYANNKLEYDSAIYSSILWSVLATSLIYYVFVKM